MCAFKKSFIDRLRCTICLGSIRKRPLSPQSFQDRIVPEDRNLIVEMARKAVLEKRDFEVEFRIDLPDGRTRYVHSVGHPLVGADGEVTELVGTHIDVTEQRLARQALQKAFDEIQKSEDRLRLVIDTIPTLVWRAGRKGFPISSINRRSTIQVSLWTRPKPVGLSLFILTTGRACW